MFSEPQELLLQQLRLLEWLNRGPQREAGGQGSVTAIEGVVSMREKWDLLGGLQLSDWQIRCRDEWFRRGHKGTVKVVTGAGKTVLALAIAQKLQNEIDGELRVAIVVPTVVLMNQWFDQLTGESALKTTGVGRLGGGFKDEFSATCRILVAVLDSAQSRLPNMVVASQIAPHLLLIADECHRAGAPEMRKVLSTSRTYSLGLSATPEREREEDDDQAFDESIVGRELGGIIFELTLAEALGLGIVPSYTIRHYGLPLTDGERFQYDKLSRAITDGRRDLQSFAASEKRRTNFFAWVQRVAKRSGHPACDLANRFLFDTKKRKELLYTADARVRAVLELLRVFESDARQQAILFHESIDAINHLFFLLQEKGLPVVLEHSELPRELRDAGLDLFRRGIARIVVSARSLIEGFNVPAVDVGIVAASSTSARQRIQSMGRVLRRHRTSTGEEKNPVIHILYIRDTVDDAIYAQEDWEKLTGAERNEYFRWNPGEEPEQQPGPPRIALPRDSDIDVKDLEPGKLYPGRIEGELYSSDSQGNLKAPDGSYLPDPYGVARAVIEALGRPGRFYITPRRFYVLVRVPEAGDWLTRFVIRLPGPIPLTATDGSLERPTVNREEWLQTAKPGDIYAPGDAGVVDKLKFSQKRNGIISKKVPSGEVFVRTRGEAANPTRGDDASRVLGALQMLRSSGEHVSHFEINNNLDAVYRREGQIHFLATLREGLEFPES